MNLKNTSTKAIIFTIGALIILAIGSFAYFSQNRNPKNLENSTAIGQTTKGTPGNQADETTTENSEESISSDTNENTKKTNPSTSNLKTPTGNFVSSHEGIQMDSIIASSCSTSPGAKCTIRFTMGNVSKSLPEQTTDKEGATFWEWTPSKIGLTPGEWKIEAIATSGSTTKSAQDALTLRIE